MIDHRQQNDHDNVWANSFGDIMYDILVTEPRLVTERENIFIDNVKFEEFKSTTININNSAPNILNVLVYASSFTNITNTEPTQNGGSLYLSNCRSVQLFVTSIGSKIPEECYGIHCYIVYDTPNSNKTVISCSSIDQATNGISCVFLDYGNQTISNTNITNINALVDSAYDLFHGNEGSTIEYGNFIGNNETLSRSILSHCACDYLLRYSNINKNTVLHTGHDGNIVGIYYAFNVNNKNTLTIFHANFIDNIAPGTIIYRDIYQKTELALIHYFNNKAPYHNDDSQNTFNIFGYICNDVQMTFMNPKLKGRMFARIFECKTLYFTKLSYIQESIQ